MLKAKSTNSLVVADEFVLWSSAVIVGYSCTLPLIGFSSPLLAQELLQLNVLLQILMVGTLLVGLLVLANGVVSHGDRRILYLAGSGLLMFLLSIQPTAACCSAILAWTAGGLPTSELRLADVLGHFLPAIGGAQLIIAMQLQSSRRQRATKAGSFGDKSIGHLRSRKVK